jgi:hypothetical protein
MKRERVMISPPVLTELRNAGNQDACSPVLRRGIAMATGHPLWIDHGLLMRMSISIPY